MIKLILFTIFIVCLIILLIFLVIKKHEKYTDRQNMAAIGALRSSHPDEYNIIGGIPKGLGWL